MPGSASLRRLVGLDLRRDELGGLSRRVPERQGQRRPRGLLRALPLGARQLVQPRAAAVARMHPAPARVVHVHVRPARLVPELTPSHALSSDCGLSL